MKSKRYLIFGSILLTSFAIYISQHQKVPFEHMEVCFTPSQKCTPLIIRNIRKAKNSIYVQAYTWTSKDISQALVEMKKKGVEIKIILDKVNMNKNNVIHFLQQNNINLMIDHVPGIAHNKIIVIDDHTVITGSFNFSKAADTKNVENVVKIQSKEVNQIYMKNWIKRQKFAQDIDNVVVSKNAYKPWKENYKYHYKKHDRYK
ncbi:phospholipase D family nuclease [Candidatus Cytomitobacter primus]|uniref:Phospholipase D n=1 Tax=Candidatus Cytomitobacter primus TaxID=2066024 RepID=A0A5C0UFD6_9PROT|nr:phospholipase D family protein [Candidatus Cytomitobacter primus]QEK38816.1 phospholipase D family protein [Candidatus Cytomitobacter primus]